MAYEDRILRMVRQPKPAGFSGAKDRYRSRTGGGYPGPRKYRRGLQGRGLGSFENQMMMDRLRGPAGMNLANQPQKSGKFLDLLKKFGQGLNSNLFPRKGLESLHKLPDYSKEEESKMIPIPNWVQGEDENSISNLGDTGYYDDPYYELGSGIIYDSPYGGTTYNVGGMDAGDILRPVEKRQFPMNIPAGPFGDARDVNPEISVEFDRDKQAIQSDDLYGDQLSGTFGLPFNLLQDPTADGGIWDYFGRKIQGDEIDEENYEPYQEPTLEEKRKRFMQAYG